MAAIEKRSREDWQELDKDHHLHPFTDHKELHKKRSRIITRAEGVYIYDADVAAVSHHIILKVNDLFNI